MNHILQKFLNPFWKIRKLFFVFVFVAISVVVGTFVFIQIPDAPLRLTPEQAAQREFKFLQMGSYVWIEKYGYQSIEALTFNTQNSIPVYGTSDDVPDIIFFTIECKDKDVCPEYAPASLLPEDHIYPDDYKDYVVTLRGREKENTLYYLGSEWYGVPPHATSTSKVQAFGYSFGNKVTGPDMGEITYAQFQNRVTDYRLHFKNHRQSFEHKFEVFKKIIGI